tara:strand:+ start:78357 stop:78512 length:156 start_codon:yes stop_codon:yes gene_type:complete
MEAVFNIIYHNITKYLFLINGILFKYNLVSSIGNVFYEFKKDRMLPIIILI